MQDVIVAQMGALGLDEVIEDELRGAVDEPLVAIVPGRQVELDVDDVTLALRTGVTARALCVDAGAEIDMPRPGAHAVGSLGEQRLE